MHIQDIFHKGNIQGHARNEKYRLHDEISCSGIALKDVRLVSVARALTKKLRTQLREP